MHVQTQPPLPNDIPNINNVLLLDIWAYMDMWYPEYYKASIPNSIKPKPLTQTKPLTTPPLPYHERQHSKTPNRECNSKQPASLADAIDVVALAMPPGIRVRRGSRRASMQSKIHSYMSWNQATLEQRTLANIFIKHLHMLLARSRHGCALGKRGGLVMSFGHPGPGACGWGLVGSRGNRGRWRSRSDDFVGLASLARGSIIRIRGHTLLPTASSF